MKQQKSHLSKPEVSSGFAQRELDKAEKQFEAFDEQVKSLTMESTKNVPVQDQEAQTKLSSRELAKSKDIYLKPKRTIPDRQKFNERFRDEWNFRKEYVNFIAEHKELIGEHINCWTHPFGGVGAEEWEVPTNKPIWAPRYVADQLKRKSYNRLTMQNSPSDSAGGHQFYGTLAVESKVQRLDAYPVRGATTSYGDSAF